MNKNSCIICNEEYDDVDIPFGVEQSDGCATCAGYLEDFDLENIALGVDPKSVIIVGVYGSFEYDGDVFVVTDEETSKVIMSGKESVCDSCIKELYMSDKLKLIDNGSYL